MQHNCLVCGKGDDDRPTIFKGEEHCSEAHRQLIAKEKNSNPQNTNSVVE